jgi:hypothetical protein
VNRLLGAASICVMATVAESASAAAELSTQVSANRVEVGQEFTLQLSCMADSRAAAPSNPRLNVPRGISARGPSLSTQQNVSIINGRIQQQSGLVATWVLVASAEGRYRLGPATIDIDGQRMSDRAVDVQVVARGTLPQSNRPRLRARGFDPFDPFGGDPFSGPMFPPGVNLLTTPAPDEIPSHPPDLDIDRARDPLAFLDARVSATHIVVGEQATLRIYAYGKPGPFELGISGEPSRDDFLSYQNERDNPIGPLYRIKIGEDVWFARKVLSYALFPTKTGRLRIGEAEATFAGAGLLGGNTYRNAQRRSQPLEIIVDEPPLAGRPPGYHLGDVGSFHLSANVEPRRIKSGEAISVQVEVAGTGQLPQRLDPPEQRGLDWLEPTTTQQVDVQRERVAGRRQFTFVVRIDRPGTLHLGRFRFPYFDPTTRKYAVASAELGDVDVEPNGATTSSGTPGTASTANAEENADPFLSALHARGKLRGPSRPARYFAEEVSYFYWLLAGPFLGLALFAASSGLKRWTNWRQSVTGSARALLDAERKAAQSALLADDPALAASAIERLVHLLIENIAGLKSRAVLRSELARELEQRGFDADMSRTLVSLLERCDHVRFVQPSLDAARSLVKDAEAATLALQPTLKKKMRRSA